MNIFMQKFPIGRYLSFFLIGSIFLFGLISSVSPANAGSPINNTPFLYPPFFGRSAEGSIFDHSSPNYSSTDNVIVTYQGETLSRECPKNAPAGFPAPNGLCDRGFGGYWSYLLGTYVFYNGHDAVDYTIGTRQVLAAADTSMVVYAGWYNPQDHRSNLGIYVRLKHPTGYDTWYGHLSSLAVQSCLPGKCSFIPRGTVIGTSGSTGNAAGPNLHFRVTDPQGKPVDPYGWAGKKGGDPWTANQTSSLWVQYPDNSTTNARVYPSGAALIQNNTPTNGIIVDELDSRFDQVPENCWRVINTSPTNSLNSRMLAVTPITTGSSTCTARWKVPTSLGTGLISVSARIPVVHATSQGAVYEIFHNGETSSILADQSAFTNPSTSNGWVFLGNYYFSGDEQEYVQLGNLTMDEANPAADLELAADAIRFISILPGTAVPTPTTTLLPALSGIQNQTPTPLVMDKPAAQMTPASTSTVTKPSPTRWPTATMFYTQVKLFFTHARNLEKRIPALNVERTRYVTSGQDLHKVVLDQYFIGPGATERYSYGDIGIYDGFTGYSKLEFADGVLRIQLKGTCKQQYPSFSIADLLTLNMKQFPEVRYVRIYDEKGLTQQAEGKIDSIPECLSAIPTAVPTRKP